VVLSGCNARVMLKFRHEIHVMGHALVPQSLRMA
jgi:hypothetical protein